MSPFANSEMSEEREPENLKIMRRIARGLYYGEIPRYTYSENRHNTFQQLVDHMLNPVDEYELLGFCEHISDMAESGQFEPEPKNDEAINIDIDEFIVRAAYSVLYNVVQDDIASTVTNLTPLQHIISFELGIREIDRINKIKRRILAKSSGLKGGADLREYERDILGTRGISLL